MKLAIVGFGATGLSALIQIIARCAERQDLKLSEIVIVSTPAEFIVGRAYHSPDIEHLLNTAAKFMSCYPNDPLHFVHWLAIKGSTQKFPPRSVFGQYLCEQFELAKQRAAHCGILLTVLLKEAQAISTSSSGRYQLTIADQTKINVDKVVYTPGQPPTSIFGSDGTYPSCIQFHSHSEWPSGVRPDAKGEIAILGGGLTAVDAIISARKRDDVKIIHVFSRSGLLPSINCRNPDDHRWLLEPRRFSHMALQNLIDEDRFSFRNAMQLLWKDLREYPIHELAANSKPLKELDVAGFYGRILQLAKNNFLPLHGLLASTRPYLSDMWHAASHEQKVEFQKFARQWIVFRHPIPYDNGEKLFKLLDSGRLRVHRITNMQQMENGMQLLTPNATKTFKTVLHAAGYGFDVKASNSLFDQSLLASRIVKRHPFGGIEVCANTLQSRPGFFAAGQIVRGVFHATNAFWFNVKLTQKIANHLG